MFLFRLQPGMFDAGAQAVEHLAAGFLRHADHLVGRIEIIVGRIGGIEVHQREDEMRVDHPLAAVPQRPVMIAGPGEFHFPEIGREIRDPPVGKIRRTVRRMLVDVEFPGDAAEIRFRAERLLPNGIHDKIFPCFPARRMAVPAAGVMYPGAGSFIYCSSASTSMKSCFFSGKVISEPETERSLPVSRSFADFTLPLQVSFAVMSPV